MTPEAKQKFDEHLLEVFGERCTEFSQQLRANLRSLWVHGITSGLSAKDVGQMPPMSREEQAMHEYQPRPEPEEPLPPGSFEAVRPGMQPAGHPSPERDTRHPMCPHCGGTGMGDYPWECHSCGGSGNSRR